MDTTEENFSSSGRTMLQRCIVRACKATYGLNERLYTCRRCGGLLEVEPVFSSAVGAEWRSVWSTRRASLEAKDRSGVWRYRELLPFPDDAPIVSLAEGNTPLYDAPRSAAYCGLSGLRLKHQGCN